MAQDAYDLAMKHAEKLNHAEWIRQYKPTGSRFNKFYPHPLAEELIRMVSDKKHPMFPATAEEVQSVFMYGRDFFKSMGYEKGGRA